MVDSFKSTKPETLGNFLGKHFIYTYENDWLFEMYIKNSRTVDYRIHTGMVAGRWVRDQEAHIVRISDDVVKLSWEEPTGTIASVAINFDERRIHGVIFYTQWVIENPSETICFQNEHLKRMRVLRDAGPTYPKVVIDEFATITFIEDCGLDNESVIDCAPSELPPGYTARRN